MKSTEEIQRAIDMQPEEDIAVDFPKTVEVPLNWLEGLANMAERASDAQDKHFETTNELCPPAMSALIGYASSAREIIK